MQYLVFPFGKYKGVKLRELPSTYIVFALETFELPHELRTEMYRILLGRFYVYSGMNKQLKGFKAEFKSKTKAYDAFSELLTNKYLSYEELF